jgi:manganese/zinc/iron transport system substrate-binding protein
MLPLLFACSTKPKSDQLASWMQEDEKIKVLCTTAMIDDLVKQVGGDLVDSIILIKGEIDPHSYELVKGDAEKLTRADLIFSNGLGLEHGASIHYALSHREGVYTLGSHLFENFKERIITVDGVIDPHVWMDVGLWLEIIDPIVAALSQKDPMHAKEFEQRGLLAKEKLKILDRKVESLMEEIPSEERFLVTSHDAFNYFAKRYLATKEEKVSGLWKRRFQAPEGLSPDGQMGMHNIEEMISHLKKYNIERVFPESNVSLDSLKKIQAVAQSKGICVTFATDFLYADSMSGNGKEGVTYEEMILHNTYTIKQLKKE